MLRKISSFTIIFLFVGILLTSLTSCKDGSKSLLSPKTPTEIEVWNYYNGNQLSAFNDLVNQFNTNLGNQLGIRVTSVSQGDINTLSDNLMASASQTPGSQPLPNLAAVYAETAFLLDQEGLLASLDSYFTKDELKTFVPGFIEEGRFNSDGDLMLFPILKSTELFSVNSTDFSAFADACDVSFSDIKTKEDLTRISKLYYDWTDSLTAEIIEDGKAFYGRDSLANYIFISTYQMGHPMFTLDDGKLKVDLDKETFRIIWDNYYIPYINGYFGSYGKFRSDDCKTGKILALTSSSSSVGYLPTFVIDNDDQSHNIDTYITSELNFKDAKVDAIVQQGASYCVIKGTEAQIQASVEFLKWFTEAERNIKFALMSGYSPVKLQANNKDLIASNYQDSLDSPKARNTLNGLIISSQAFTNREAYASKPFAQSKDVRSVLEKSLDYIAKKDRATVVEAIGQGKTKAEATSLFTSDQYFDQWFESLCQSINELLGK